MSGLRIIHHGVVVHGLHGLSCFKACGIFVPQPVIQPMSPALQGRFLNHWTTNEVPGRGWVFSMFSELLGNGSDWWFRLSATWKTRNKSVQQSILLNLKWPWKIASLWHIRIMCRVVLMAQTLWKSFGYNGSQMFRDHNAFLPLMSRVALQGWGCGGGGGAGGGGVVRCEPLTPLSTNKRHNWTVGKFATWLSQMWWVLFITISK